jgi:hypothetical protein
LRMKPVSAAPNFRLSFSLQWIEMGCDGLFAE